MTKDTFQNQRNETPVVGSELSRNPTNLMTVQETAERLAVSPSCVYQLVDTGKLACHRIGIGRGAIRVAEQDLKNYLASCRQEKKGEEPSDLDKIFQIWQRRLSGIVGGVGGQSAGSSGGYILAVLLLVAWGLTGLYRVDEAERGIVQRFGAYTVTTLPGLHWHFPYPTETVDIVNTNEVNNYPFRTEILTADEQYVFIQIVVQYRRSDPVKYSFEIVDPESTLQDVTESALREVIGTSTLLELVTEQRDQIAPSTREILQTTLDSYGAGITITSISLEKLDYPQAVQSAVDDTQKARNVVTV